MNPNKIKKNQPHLKIVYIRIVFDRINNICLITINIKALKYILLMSGSTSLRSIDKYSTRMKSGISMRSWLFSINDLMKESGRRA